MNEDIAYRLGTSDRDVRSIEKLKFMVWWMNVDMNNKKKRKLAKKFDTFWHELDAEIANWGYVQQAMREVE